jgi:NAD(P)-dependent dehydrogenase (short-subunit alcohol dehydrogenase family)
MSENAEAPSLPFAGQLAIVTGASRGIGAATAQALAKAGAHVVLTARNAKDLEAVEDEIYRAGGQATIAPLDLTDADSVGRLANAVASRWDRLDILVSNAAMLGNLGPVAGIDGKEFNRILTLNVLAQQALIAGFDPLLRAASDARVLAMSSSVGRTPRAFWGAYGASKAAFENLYLSYGEEWRARGTPRVAVVNPGKTRTKMRADAYPGEDPATVKLPAVVAERLTELLASDFATGTYLTIDD